jgi:hypothetical protein
MGHCSLCGAELALPFECSRCGETFCYEHRFPENHFCRINRDTFSQDPGAPKNNIPAEESQFRGSVNVSEKKSFSKIVLSAFAIVLLASATTSFLLGTSLSNPGVQSNGNSNDYITGYANGNSTGYHAGFIEGNFSGYIAGHTDGNLTGYLAGCADGNASGYAVGYQKGLKDAVRSGAYLIRDPSYEEMESFLASDETDSHEYDELDYNCYDFASDVCNHAFQLGYRCGFVYIELSNSTEDFIAGRISGAHAIVCFNTTDRGLIFIEPQYDVEVSLTKGEPITVIEWGFSYYLMTEVIFDYGIIW